MRLRHLEETLVMPERIVCVEAKRGQHLIGFPMATPFHREPIAYIVPLSDMAELESRDTPHIAYDG